MLSFYARIPVTRPRIIHQNLFELAVLALVASLNFKSSLLRVSSSPCLSLFMTTFRRREEHGFFPRCIEAQRGLVACLQVTDRTGTWVCGSSWCPDE